jgi:tetratricopeptide (TPR) repeat protein
VSLLTTVRLWHLVVGSPPLSAVDSEIKALPEGELVHFHNSMARVLFEAMRDVDAARELFDHALQLLEERKNLLGGAGSLSAGARIELLAGDAAAAARWARAGVEALGELGATVERALSLWVLADALTDLGEVDDADRCAEEARDFWSADDVPVPLQLEARRVCGRIRAARGEHETAEQLAREATAIALTTEQPIEQALTYATLAEVLARAGKLDEAREEREIALELCRQKQAPTYIGYINRRLDALLETTVGESSS